MQILHVLTEEKDRKLLYAWCCEVQEAPEEIYELTAMLDENYSIELSDIQIERLAKVCESGKFKSAFEIQK